MQGRDQLAQRLDPGLEQLDDFLGRLLARDEAVHRQLGHAFDLFYPQKTLQERKLGVASFIARHGHYFVDWVFDAIDLWPDAAPGLRVSVDAWEPYLEAA